VLKDILENFTYDVLLVPVELQAKENIMIIKPDLIILDHNFEEDLEGWQLIQQLKLDKNTANIPIIFCTAADQLATRLSTEFKAKNVKVIIKPFEIGDLIQKVEISLIHSK
jgi:CheY-like chemotaxis protein